ncbi:hypothetical protein DBV05_g4808 [Lasiodiplodia theobromae]|uniref:Core Histone H2A/H2B/H3 domain-containing protein n=1 Tax=Lasiodiplodia theobromae TaxID=45133 RepID=A0A5N5DFQ0_9PEZI|nr:hypothetical protein DBV05_g4808 [Lasiodiplodia theobromae]
MPPSRAVIYPIAIAGPSLPSRSPPMPPRWPPALVRRVLRQVDDGYTTEATAVNAVREAAETYKVAFPDDAERFAREEGVQTVQVRHLQRAVQARDERASENPPQ